MCKRSTRTFFYCICSKSNMWAMVTLSSKMKQKLMFLITKYINININMRPVSP